MNASRHLCVEPFRPHLTEAVIALNEASFSSLWGERWSSQDLRTALSLKNMDLLLASDGEETLFGFLLSRTIESEAEVLLIGVVPEERQHGVASALMAEFIHEARRKSLSKVFLEVRESNFVAKSMYDKFDFEQIGLRQNYYKGKDGQRSSAITLALDLTNA